ncbi:MAG: hypothetical protein LKF80_16410 [Brevundimonas sp.]|uniref:hypothetical protein n=1 Tax=Brevundimonas TaxID=41275 RepID=UPI0025C45792|nr:hypothetical protein [Brevundimonas sp.]MCH4269974.1 hypothetical protein [Brevundimonas sp.]
MQLTRDPFDENDIAKQADSLSAGSGRNIQFMIVREPHPATASGEERNHMGRHGY